MSFYNGPAGGAYDIGTKPRSRAAYRRFIVADDAAQAAVAFAITLRGAGAADAEAATAVATGR